MTRRDIPNLITLLRILLVPPFLFALWKGDYWVALALFLVAGASDGLDGFLAKRYDWGTRFGSILDPIADKLLLVGAFLALTWMGRIPLWLAIVVLGRDVLIVLGAVAYHFWIGRYRLDPAGLSKINTLIQIVLVLVVIITAATGKTPVGEQLTTWLIYITMVTTVISGVHYTFVWGRRALMIKRSPLSKQHRQSPPPSGEGL